MITELRLLPPLAIGRLGSAEEPLVAYDLVVSPEDPLDYRQIVPATTFEVDVNSGEIVRTYVPDSVRFKDAKKRIYPVAPFIEVFAVLDSSPEDLVPVTPELLAAEGLSLEAVTWEVEVANNKAYRRTEDVGDKITASIRLQENYARTPLEGTGPNLLAGRTLPLGHIQVIRPTKEEPNLRLRFTPAKGLVYGASPTRMTGTGKAEADPVVVGEGWDRIIYDAKKGKWLGYADPSDSPVTTNPGSIYAGYGDADGLQHSWGYLDDECDGYVRVTLKRADGACLVAVSHICAGPPTFAPDTLPVRVISDELEQIMLGPKVEEEEISIDEAEDIVRRSLETIRLLNTTVMNGNPVYGRQRVASTMSAQDANDYHRDYEPIAAAAIVDNLALQQLHRRVFSTLSSGTAAWFGEVLRRPEEIGDLTSNGRRKMPAMMRGADARALTLTRRQIDIVTRAAAKAMFRVDPAKHEGEQNEREA
ncbi:hypothetical protein [Cupriavidus sp. H18C2]|uniref:hypothetical protein n=1 Tax=Cupriavidus sp. H18C2 TaxID=3241602 RepID=UPI003BF7A140